MKGGVNMDTEVLAPNTSLASIAMESGAQAAGGGFVDKALNGIVDFCKSRYGEGRVHLGNAFTRYLTNSTQRLNLVKTLATGSNPRHIIGENNIYVQIGVSYEGREIDTSSVDPLLRINKNIIILGTGGIGKSMLTRYLFLNTAHRGEYVPVLLELRKISAQPVESVSILDLIFGCMKDYDVDLPKEQFEYSLRHGKYLFLLDGFDEIKESHVDAAIQEIQNFCAKYPKNSCIVTSRPRRNTSPLETFSTVESMCMSKAQAISLASKLWPEDEKTKEFCRQLDEELFRKHKDFAENPLLLSMMFLTFMRNNSIPDHLADFYSKAYDALYSLHDTNDKGVYRREFQCNELDETGFKHIFSHFCFHTYRIEKYEFAKDEIVKFIDKAIQKTGYSNIQPESYISDLCDAICVIVDDGGVYRFAHRSFQAYFAAYYMSAYISDDNQKRVLHDQIYEEDWVWDREDFFLTLIQIEPNRFAENALEDGLREIAAEAKKNDQYYIYLLRQTHGDVSCHIKPDNTPQLSFAIIPGKYYNLISLFPYVYRNITYDSQEQRNPSRKTINLILKKYAQWSSGSKYTSMLFSEIDNNQAISQEERFDFYSSVAHLLQIQNTLNAIQQWITDLDQFRAKKDTDDFFDEL